MRKTAAAINNVLMSKKAIRHQLAVNDKLYKIDEQPKNPKVGARPINEKENTIKVAAMYGREMEKPFSSSSSLRYSPCDFKLKNTVYIPAKESMQVILQANEAIMEELEKLVNPIRLRPRQ